MSMKDPSKQAIILAGGKGERLRPLTSDRPKPMICVLDKPILSYSLNWLKSSGIEQVVISCGYRHEVICEYVGDGSQFGLTVSYSIEERPLGRGGGIKLASRSLTASQAPVIVLNGDILTDLPLRELVGYHAKSGSAVTIVTVPLRSPYGIADVDDDSNVTAFREKPVLPFWINAGIYAINHDTLSHFPDEGDHEETLFPGLAARYELKAFKYTGFWRAVDNAKDLTELEKELKATTGSIR